MRSGPHWNGYPPDDPPQGPWCSRCSHHAEDCECPDDEVQAILDANPILKSAGFEAKAKRWNALLDYTREKKFTAEQAVAFIKEHMP